MRRGRRSRGAAPLAANELERAWLGRIAAQETRPLEIRQVRVHRRRRREPDRLADLADGRRVALPLAVLDEELPDLSLPGGQHHASLSNVCSIRLARRPDGVKTDVSDRE